jgi:hypothetical protein
MTMTTTAITMTAAVADTKVDEGITIGVVTATATTGAITTAS